MRRLFYITPLVIFLGFALGVPLVFAQGGISQLQQFTSTTTPSSAITQTTFGKALKITGLATGACLALDSDSLLTTTTCGSGGSSFGYPFPSNATTTLLNFNGGLASATTTANSLTISGNESLASWTTNGPNLAVAANTLTDTTGSGTSGLHVSNSFGIPTFASSNALSLTRAANVYIAGAPIAGTNVTIVNPFALQVNSGNSYFAGLNAFGALNPGGGPTAQVTLENGFSTANTWTANGVQIATQNNALFTDTASAPGTNIATRVANSLSPAMFAFFTGTSTITNAATLDITGAPIANASSSIITAAYSFMVGSGDSKFLGNIGSNLSSGTQAEQWLTMMASTTTAAPGSSQIGLKSNRAALVAGGLIGGIDFRSNDTNLTAPGIVTASIQALANTIHTAAALGTDLVFSGTTGTTYGEKMRLTGAGNLGIGTSTPPSRLTVANEPVGDGTVATTTVDFGDYATTTSSTCFNVKNTAGAAISFYFIGTSQIIENNRCH